ncbi:copper resistance protein NlpE N-terminal domain-containing protein [Chitinophaga qingshengii]|uniref:Copper resistance protein NlpE N-terminal domain-containing protein n=1 Tax=Chitinophaga qingshengii TaxID=1569794 RepID=A0ABR7TP72_9BACT|nr:copper resistance protein NlpE N-terminal domain-containing protein [Chitinophaga qingshengii]MBC9931435.1 copper resistance protein NlpE N-terminal domain-containing protein [Chitinophaga qingshengii]
MRTLIGLSALFAVLTACNNHPTTQTGTDSATGGTTTPKATTTATHITGTYQGTLPCADCPGMDYQISLFDDHTFTELVSYQGRGQGIAYTEKGTWQQINDSIVSIKKKTDSSSFLASENKLLVLDKQGKRIEGALASNYVLKPVEGGDRRDILARKASDGVTFTANGNEPFWSLDVEARKIKFYTAAGDSVLATLPAARPNTDTLKVYTTPQLTVSIRNVMCTDDMSGLMRPNTVEVKVKDQTYHGCGEYVK